jgi:predicted ATPase
VLDNFEQVVDAALLLAGLLDAAPDLKLLVTSRAVLRLASEHEFALPALGAVEARTLFAERAQAADRTFVLDGDVAEAVDEICARLDGLPLAIELAAARVKLLPPPAMLPRLSRRLDLLARGARDAPARQQTLRGALDWSYELLAPDEQRLLARLGVFAGGCTLEAVDRVGRGRDGSVLPALEALVDNSLVSHAGREEPRFLLLETVREYALERLAASGEELALRRRHAEYFVELATEGGEALRGPEQGAWLARLAREHDNLRAAIAFGLEHDRDLALAIGIALMRFWEIRGHLAEGLRTMAAALEGREEVTPERAKALNTAGVLAAEQGDYDAADRFFETALAVAQELGDPTHVAVALGNAGNIARFRGDLDRAGELYEECLREWERSPTPRLAIPLANLGVATFYRGDLDRATALFAQARGHALNAGDRRHAGVVQREVARVELARGDLDRAQALLAESLAVARDLGDTRGVANCLETLAKLAVERGDADRAAGFLATADELRDAVGGRRPPDEAAEIEALRARLAGADAVTVEAAAEYAAGWGPERGCPRPDSNQRHAV